MDDAPEKRPRVTFVGDMTKVSEELRKSLAAIPQLPKLNIPVASRPDLVMPPPNPSVRTAAEVEKLNHQTDTLVRAVLELIAVTKSSNRLNVRLGLLTAFLTALVVALTLVLVLR